ncbi:MAG TPA: hypothetical protein PLP42_08130 [Acidobacteriota bacterium]|nr:hypothetical protein [Acidobacteriota bacterium]
MFPGVHGFHWEFGHLLFLGIFFTVVLVILGASSLGFAHSIRRLRSERREQFVWEQQFEDLTPDEKACRHAMTGELKGRICPNAFDCNDCSTHASLLEKRSVEKPETVEIAGLRYHPQRRYHRGHTWLEELDDGTVLIGPDEFARRLIGQPDRLVLPKPGDRLVANGVAWTVHKSGADVRVLAPVTGEVLESGEGQEWYLRVRPDSPIGEAKHLLSGSEIGPWIRHELERLQRQASLSEVGSALADGGELVDTVSQAFDKRRWDHVCSSYFLQP